MIIFIPLFPLQIENGFGQKKKKEKKEKAYKKKSSY